MRKLDIPLFSTLSTDKQSTIVFKKNLIWINTHGLTTIFFYFSFLQINEYQKLYKKQSAYFIQ